MKMRALALLLTLLFLRPCVANAQGGLGFTISPSDITIFQGDIFSISSTVFNSPPPNMQTYTVGSMVDVTFSDPTLNYFFNVDPGANLGDVTSRSYAPRQSATAAEFLKFTSDTATPTGDYVATVQLYDNNNAPLVNQSFNIHILAVPEFGTTLSVAGLLGAGGYGLWRQRRQYRLSGAAASEILSGEVTSGMETAEA